jgi:hypothetical protein
LYHHTIFDRSGNPEPFWDRRINGGWLLAVRGEVSTVAHAQHFPDEDHAMRVTCYLIWGLAVAIWVGLLVYAMLFL